MSKRHLIDLNDAIQHPGRHLTFDVETDLEEEADLDLVSPVQGKIDAVSTGNLLLISGSLATRAILECGRCLAPVQIDVAFELEENFPVVGTPAGFGGNSFAHVEVDEPFPLFQGNSLVWEELIRQNLMVSLPTHVLCKPDCPGIEGRDENEEHGIPAFADISKHLHDKEEGRG
jgi:uncharacterized protein